MKIPSPPQGPSAAAASLREFVERIQGRHLVTPGQFRNDGFTHIDGRTVTIVNEMGLSALL